RLTAMSYTPDLHRFYHHAASTDIYTSSLHDALPISPLRRRQRLAPLRVFAIDRDGLQAELPPLDVDVVDFVDRRVLGHVDGLGNRPAHEGLDGRHHFDVPHVMDRALAFEGLERAIEDGEVLVLEAGRALDGVVGVDVGLDGCPL